MYRNLVLVGQEKLGVKRIIIHLIEGQMCVCFIKTRLIRSNRIIIQRVGVGGLNKDVF